MTAGDFELLRLMDLRRCELVPRSYRQREIIEDLSDTNEALRWLEEAARDHEEDVLK